MDPWSTLGVARDSSPDDIKKAYRKMAMQHHPDRGGNTEQFQKIQQAYDDITSGRAEEQIHVNRGGQGWNPFGDNSWANFGEGFGAPPFGFRQQMRRMEDVSIQYNVTLEDLYEGKHDRIRVLLPDRSSHIELHVNIDPGTPSNARIRYPGMVPSRMNNIVPGDAYLILNQVPHHVFRRVDDDLYMEKDISIFDAMLGRDVNVHTIDRRELNLRLPPGSKPGLRLRVAGAGMPRSNGRGNHGDLYVQLNITIPALKPEDLDKKLIDLMNEHK